MTDWWLNGGILPADCIGAYQAIGAASYAASLVNLANPGTYDLTAPVGTPVWNTTDGWIGGGIAVDTHLETGINPHHDWSVIVRVALTNDGDYYYFNGLIFTTGAGANFGLAVSVYAGLNTVTYVENKSDYDSSGSAQYSSMVSTAIYGLVAGNFYIDDSIHETVTPGYHEVSGNLLLMKQNAYFDGTYQAAAIYNRTLSDSEYLDIWAAISGLPGNPIDYLPIHVAGSNIYVIP
jgi:hypothetical protein